MNRHNNHKKRVIISFDNLSEELRELFKEAYPAEDGGYQPFLQKTIKPNGEPILSVPLETEDTTYMVKFAVKIDSNLVEEDIDKDMFSDGMKDDVDISTIERDENDDKNSSHSEFHLKHGNYDDDFLANTSSDADDSDFDKEDEDFDDKDDFDADDDDDLMDFEPDDEALKNIEMELLGGDFISEDKSKKKKTSTEVISETKKTTKTKNTKASKEPNVCKTNASKSEKVSKTKKTKTSNK